MAILAGIFLLGGDHNKEKPKPAPIVAGPDEDLVTVVVPEDARPGHWLKVYSPFTTAAKSYVTVPEGNIPGSSFNIVVPRKYSAMKMTVPDGKGPGAVSHAVLL